MNPKSFIFCSSVISEAWLIYRYNVAVKTLSENRTYPACRYVTLDGTVADPT